MSSIVLRSCHSPNRSNSSLRLVVHIALGLGLVFSFGCSANVFDNLGEITKLRNQLTKQFPQEQITLNLHNATALQITFTDSPLNESQVDERIMRAQNTALLAKRHYSGIARLDRISISFVRSETEMFIVTYTQEIDNFVFDREAKPIGAPANYHPSEFAGEQDAHVVYNAARDESEVRITRLQLSGDGDKGLILSPHFKLRGDATTAGRSRGIPSAIVFTFASFAPEKIFKADPRLRIVADGYTIFNDKAHNQSLNTEGGNEFMVQGVPLEQFLKMTQAKTVILELGENEYLLSDRQLGALREMASYAEPGRK